MNADPGEVEALIAEDAEMRVGRKLRRTLYLRPQGTPGSYEGDMVVGIVDSEALAAEIVRRWNRRIVDDETWGLDAQPGLHVCVGGEPPTPAEPVPNWTDCDYCVRCGVTFDVPTPCPLCEECYRAT